MDTAVATADTTSLTLDCANSPNDGAILQQDGPTLLFTVEESDDACTIVLDGQGETALRDWLNARHAGAVA